MTRIGTRIFPGSGSNGAEANAKVQASLTAANLYRAYLIAADLTGADLTGADLTGAILILIAADLTQGQLNTAKGDRTRTTIRLEYPDHWPKGDKGDN